MMKSTNYDLNKPEITDYYSVEDFNANTDIIDSQLKSNANAINSHTADKNNPHGITAAQLGLDNVDNTTDANKPISTATQAALDNKVDKISGKGLSTNDYSSTEKAKLAGIAAGAQVNTITGVKGNGETTYRTGNVNITPANIGLGSVNNTSDANKPVSTAQQNAINAAKTSANAYTDEKIAALINGAPATLDTLKEISDAMTENQSVVEALETAIGTKANASDLTSHTGNKSNPHGVTKSQVGLGNVPNVATNDQTPTHTEATSLAALTSGEKLSAAFGKIAKAISSLISHLANKSNPHSVTASQVGLGNVPNVATNNQTPTYTAASSISNLTSGEKLSTAFGKIAKAITSLIAHLSSISNPHSVTKAQVGLGNCDNTSDANKPISTATQAELDCRRVTRRIVFTNSNYDDIAISITTQVYSATNPIPMDIVTFEWQNSSSAGYTCHQLAYKGGTTKSVAFKGIDTDYWADTWTMNGTTALGTLKNEGYSTQVVAFITYNPTITTVQVQGE